MDRIISSFSGGYWWLSNFSPVPIYYEGILYPTVEHAFQASKTDDLSMKQHIASLGTPGGAKRAGRQVKLIPYWNNKRRKIMLKLLRLKFEAPDYKVLLLETGDNLLVEGNHWGDTYWGVCNGEGENHLGKLLMKVRDELRADS